MISPQQRKNLESKVKQSLTFLKPGDKLKFDTGIKFHECIPVTLSIEIDMVSTEHTKLTDKQNIKTMFNVIVGEAIKNQKEWGKIDEKANILLSNLCELADAIYIDSNISKLIPMPQDHIEVKGINFIDKLDTCFYALCTAIINK